MQDLKRHEKLDGVLGVNLGTGLSAGGGLTLHQELLMTMPGAGKPVAVFECSSFFTSFLFLCAALPLSAILVPCDTMDSKFRVRVCARCHGEGGERESWIEVDCANGEKFLKIKCRRRFGEVDILQYNIKSIG